ncbi:hypothetical protein A3K55_00240, partial [Candidatus Shapirobacteria bacterium RBG_13_44_7]
NFGCRVNAAESNQFAQYLLDHPSSKPIIFVNTCAVTQKGEYESLARVRALSQQYPNFQIIVSGCADLSKIAHLPNVTLYHDKDKLSPIYTPKIKDKFSHSQKYLLKIQSGCTANCSYCIVPQKRPHLWSLPIDQAVDTVNRAIKHNYQHLIITGVNLVQYRYDLNNLLKSLLTQTKIPLISFGSLPLSCINQEFINLITSNRSRFVNFLHIPVQSGSDKILKSMHRPYTQQQIITTFTKLQNRGFDFGTDIIVGFPNETDDDFLQTQNLCQLIGFSKIHTFRFSPRPNTEAQELYRQFPVKPSITNSRAQQIRKFIIK